MWITPFKSKWQAILACQTSKNADRFEMGGSILHTLYAQWHLKHLDCRGWFYIHEPKKELNVGLSKQL